VLLLGMALMLPFLAPIGMFLDGIVYAALSMNLANGIGDFWHLRINDSYFGRFVEHPPLGIMIQSLWFLGLGDHYLVEKLYGLVALLIAFVLIHRLWMTSLGARQTQPDVSAYWWLPIALLLVVPKWSWAYRNNLLEITLIPFCLITVLLHASGMQGGGVGRRVLVGVIAAVTTMSAFLVKGPIALFVLTAPLFVALIRPPPTARALAGYLSVYLVAVALGGAALWLHPPTAEMLDAYFHRHVYSSVDYSQGFCSDGECLYILGELFTMLSVPLVAGMVLLLFLRCRPSRGWWRPLLPAATGHMLIGISASFPIVLSTKQSSHYLLPSLPFYMLGLGLLLAAALSASDRVDRVLKRRPSPSFLLGVAILAVAVVVWSWSRVGTVRKSGEHHHDLDRIAEVTGQGRAIGIHPRLYTDWYLHNIAWRHYRIELDPEPEGQCWLLLDPPVDQAIRDDWKRVPLDTRRWQLYRRC